MRLVEDGDGAIASRLGIDYHPLYLLLDERGRPQGTPTSDPLELLAASAPS